MTRPSVDSTADDSFEKHLIVEDDPSASNLFDENAIMKKPMDNNDIAEDLMVNKTI